MIIDSRVELLTSLASSIDRAALQGVFGGSSLQLRNAIIINGPRAGAIEIDAGLDAGAFLRAIQANSSAVLRQFVPWEFSGDPHVFMAGRYIRIEIGWPNDLADSDISLSSLGQHPVAAGRWLVGRTERGSVLTAGLSDMTPHWLVAGTTGSGKTTALLSAIGQLSDDKENRLILIDAKQGASFRQFENVQGLIGPLADDIYSARSALNWSIQEMAKRYSGLRDDRRIIIVIDEVQDIIQDKPIAESLRKLMAQGRGCKIHCIVATQHPIIASLGDPTVRRNLVGRLALLVADSDASRVAIGASTPRADKLLGKGDSYAIAPGIAHRVQVAYSDKDIQYNDPEFDQWPEEQDMPNHNSWPSGAEIGSALLSAMQDHGRVKFRRAANDLGIDIKDNNRASNLLSLARETIGWMSDFDTSVCLEGKICPYKGNPGGNGQGRVPVIIQTDRQNVVDL